LPDDDQQATGESIPRIEQEGSVLTVLNLAMVTFLVLLGLNMVAPILPSYAESFGVSYTFVGFVISSFALTRMILDMPAGMLSRKYNKKNIMIAGLLLIVLSSILAGMASSYLVLVCARMIEGAGSALYVTTATVFLAQISGKEKRGQWMSLYMGMLLLGSIFGPTFGGIIAAAYDIRMPFYAYAIAAGLGIIPTLILPNLPNSGNMTSRFDRRTTFSDIREVLSAPSFLLATFATFSLFFIRTGVRTTLVPLFAANNLGQDEDTIGIILTLAGMATAVTMTPMGRLSDKIGRRNPLVLCLLLTALITILIPYSLDAFTLTLVLIVYGAFVGVSGPIAAYVTDLSPPNKLEVSMGLYRMISDSGFVVGPLLLGYLADLTATPVEGATHSGLIGVFPFAVASLILIVAGLSLLRAIDPARTKSLARRHEIHIEDGAETPSLT
jgi:DHA1 family multidrug resistance protein-like MFS transporter